MKNKKKNKKYGGFTLVELLATIAILSIVVSIGVGTVTGVVNKSNEKAYETAKNNVATAAKNYAVEKGTGWLNSDATNNCVSGKSSCEYQCISVQDLIDSGYFNDDILKSNIAKDTKLTKSDAVYLERDKVSRTITHHIFEDGRQNTLCK